MKVKYCFLFIFLGVIIFMIKTFTGTVQSRPFATRVDGEKIRLYEAPIFEGLIDNFKVFKENEGIPSSTFTGKFCVKGNTIVSEKNNKG